MADIVRLELKIDQAIQLLSALSANVAALSEKVENLQTAGATAASQFSENDDDGKMILSSPYVPASILLKMEGSSIMELACANYGVEALSKIVGVEIAQAAVLRATNCSAATAKSKGCSAKACKEAGFSAAELVRVGSPRRKQESNENLSGSRAESGKQLDFFTAGELKDCNFTARELKDAGLTCKACVEAGSTAAELIAAGFIVQDVQRAM